MCVGCRYQWDVQGTVLRVAASMRQRGFSVWVDTEMMTGSTLDAMAAAVENAYCVLICITERYKVRARSQMLAMLSRRCKAAALTRLRRCRARARKCQLPTHLDSTCPS